MTFWIVYWLCCCGCFLFGFVAAALMGANRRSGV
jgi:hypothetical protein